MENYLNVMEYAREAFLSTYGVILSIDGILKVVDMAKKYGEDETMNAIYIACEKYDDELTALMKIEGILYNRKYLKSKYFKEEKGNDDRK